MVNRPGNWFERQWRLVAAASVVLLIYTTYIWLSVQGLPDTVTEAKPGP